MSVVSDQARTRSMESGLRDLSDSLAQLKLRFLDRDREQRQQGEVLTRLSGSFKSLLQDGIRHNDVLELLLGEEVLEFLEWPVLDQESHSIPAMKEQLHLLQEQLSLRTLLGEDSGSSVEKTPSDQPDSSGSARERRRSTEQGAVLPSPGRDGGDLWRLEQQVEELEEKVRLLEEGRSTCCQHETELSGLKRELQHHLRVFERTFRNADMLADSGTSLDLMKVWTQTRDGEAEGTAEKEE